MRASKQNGFAHMGMVVLLIVVAVIGVAGWVVYKNNRVDNPEPVQNTQDDTKSSAIDEKVTINTTTLKIQDLGISLLVPEGWVMERVVDPTYGNIDNSVTSSASDIKISAYISDFPVGFSGCTDETGELDEILVEHLSNTGIAGVVVFGTSKHGLMLADETLKLGTTTKSLEAETVSIAEMKVGSTYYYCSQATPPISWSVDFDKNTSNHDGVATSLKSDPATDIHPTTVGYDEVVKILESVEKL